MLEMKTLTSSVNSRGLLFQMTTPAIVSSSQGPHSKVAINRTLGKRAQFSRIAVVSGTFEVRFCTRLYDWTSTGSERYVAGYVLGVNPMSFSTGR